MADVIVCGRCGARSWAGAIHCHACGGSLTSAGQVVVPPGQPPTAFAPPPPAVPVVPPPFAPQFAPTQFAPPQFAPSNAPAVVPPGWPVPGAPQRGPFVPYGAPSAQPWHGATGPYGAPPAGYNPGPPSGTVAARPIGITILAIVEVAIGLVGLYIAIDLFGWANCEINYSDAGLGALDLIMAVAYLATSGVAFDLARALWSMQARAWKRAFLLSTALLCLILVSVFAWGVETMDIVGAVVHLSVLAYLSMNSVRGLFGRSPATLLPGPS